MDFKKLDSQEVFKDPIYGYIRIDYKIIHDLINTKEFQRLRRIRQLSGVSQVFHTAEHSRFAHSLGAYEMARLVIENALDIKKHLSGYEQVVFLISSLLHDIGHGPYSHSFEHVTDIKHELMSAKLVLGKTQINKILSQYDNLDEDVANVILNKGKFPLVESLLSSQLDVDRMDYLSRDAYFTGASYGIIDFLRIIRAMRFVDNQVLICESAVHTVESYIMSRYHMYWQVYFHPKARASELILQSIYLRIKDLHSEGKDMGVDMNSLLSVLKSPDDLDSYINLDDAYVNGMMKKLSVGDDEILKNLSNDFFNRRLFKFKEVTEDRLNEFKNKNSTKYDYYVETKKQMAYLQSTNNKIDIGIKILTKDNKIISLEDYSEVIKGLISTPTKVVYRVFYKNDGQL